MTEEEIQQWIKRVDELGEQEDSRRIARIDPEDFAAERNHMPQEFSYRSLDSLFVSMAVEAQIWRVTLQNKTYGNNSGVSFVARLDYGQYGSCLTSTEAYGEVLRECDPRQILRHASAGCDYGTVSAVNDRRKERGE